MHLNKIQSLQNIIHARLFKHSDLHQAKAYFLHTDNQRDKTTQVSLHKKNIVKFKVKKF